jgi:osmotically-inducible protein OsmY
VSGVPNQEVNMLETTRIEGDILAALDEDPRIPSPSEIAVKAYDGAVALRGTVGSFAQRRAAGDDARKVQGVFDVDNELQVRLLDEYAREDAEIRGVALQMLNWDSELPAGSIDVKVVDGWLTLKGDVDYQFQSDYAFNDVSNLLGVVGITNEIKVVEPL